MPQLDKITYLSQVLWIFIISFNLYTILIFILLPNNTNIKKIKNRMFTGLNNILNKFFVLNFCLNGFKRNTL